ncbi:MAG: hypothetical protein V3V97_06850 [Hyphomicrobiaceae bacterium]
MSRNFHENYAQSDVALPSDRSTGIVFAVVAVIIAILLRHNMTAFASLMAVAAILLAVSFVASALLRPLNIVWFKLGLLLHKIISPLIMVLVFMIAIVPFGLVMQIVRDPLRRKRQPQLASYWVDREPELSDRQDMANQF